MVHNVFPLELLHHPTPYPLMTRYINQIKARLPHHLQGEHVVYHGGVGLHWLSHHQLCQQGSLTTIAHTTDQNISSQAFPPSPDEQYNERDKPNQQSYCNPNGVRLVLQDLILHLFEHAAMLGGSPLFPFLHISLVEVNQAILAW